ncbi:RNA-binding protein 44 isoform X2 [Engystomops pustulosus]|uniref:RNA-binding protein 44 isoform X2 n=1 Tax=Engystomops pustulosus TaxID=76066 RepID=UPI003AFA9431
MEKRGGQYNPVPLTQSTISYSVTFPVIPYQQDDITEFSDQQRSLYSYSGKVETTCEKCRLEKKVSLNRQLCELVKKHGFLEIVGKEILGWYMLLPPEDRRFIKECGHIYKYIKDNPFLSIVDNFVQLKSKSTEIFDSEIYSSMENLTYLEDTYCTADNCESMLHSADHSDYLAVSSKSSEYDLPCHVKQTIGKNLKEHESSFLEGYEKKITDGTLNIKSKDNGLNFEGPDRTVAQDEMKTTQPWLKCFSDFPDRPVDQDCSSVDDETFFSVKSGSFYSRSSSPFSLDESTDVERCVFEETLEDLSSFSFYKQSPLANFHPLLRDLSFQNTKFTTNEEIHSVVGKSKNKDVSCNTDLSGDISLPYMSKETQTNRRITQDIGVNTDPMEGGFFSQTPAAAHEEARIGKDVGESRGTSERSSSDALLQRAVKAELLLVDVQRWLCWQMCWKTQQQTIESFFNLNKEPGDQPTSGTNFNLSSALAEVEENYQEMRAKVKSGTPLDDLVPLAISAKLTTVETSTDNLLKDTFRLSGRQDISVIAAEDLKKTKCMNNDLDASFMSSLDKSFQKPDEIGPEDHLSEKPKQYYVHVGNVAHCVKEAELLDLFGKYHVNSIFLEESSLTCCYAVLTLSNSEDAEAAIKEMDGKIMYGKKLKVRAVKTSKHNLSLSFEKIKSVSTEIPLDAKGLDIAETKENVVSEPPQCDSTKPSQVQPDHRHFPPVGEVFTHTTSNNFYSPTNTHQGMAPHCISPGFSNFMPPGYPYLLQSHRSHMVSYSSMPNFAYVPFSYPSYKLHSSPFHPSVAHPNSGHLQFGKDEASVLHAMPMKSIHSTDKQSNSRTRSFVHKKRNFSATNTKLPERSTGAANMDDKCAVVKSASEPTTAFVPSMNAKPDRSKTTSQDAALKFPITPASVEENPSAECLSSPEKPRNLSEASNLKSATPLRFPTSVPSSVSIPEASKPFVNPNCRAEDGTPSANPARGSTTATSEQDDLSSAGIPDWGVLPKLTASEGPGVVIPNKLNFSQFKRVVEFLSKRHKGATRQQIVGALEDVRVNRGGSFGVMTIPQIIFAASLLLSGNFPPA